MDKFVVIDLETTGHSPANNDCIIEVGIVIIENNEICGEFSSLINPEKSIPPFITNLTGIADQDVVHAPTFREKASEIVELFKDGYLIAHNVPFDLGFLNEALAMLHLEKLHNPIIDTVELARILFPQAPSFKLGQLAEYLNITHHDPHRALSDAFVTAKLFLKLNEKLASLPYETITQLLGLEKSLNSNLHELLTKRQNELAFSTEESDEIVSHRGLAFKKIAKNKRQNPELTSSFGEYLDSIYEANGMMEQQMKHYEKRTGQRVMSEDIYDAFQSGHHAMIEAETGTGKSLAYLLPAIYEAVKSRRKIVISTYTTQLQSQLLEEEIPLIKKLVSFPFAVALMKGKEHYISLEKFERELSQQDNYDITLTKAMILVWLTETKTGDIDEIQLPSSGYLFFKRISTQTEGYIDPSSSWFRWSFYQHAKQQAQKADIIITNHALLCTDMFNNYQFLPSYNQAIIDEAHHFEETASNHYGLKLEYANIHYSLNHIGTTDNGNWLGKLVNKYPDIGDNTLMDKWNDIFGNAKYEVDDFFRNVFQYVLEQRKNDKSLSDVGRTQYRFENDKENPRKWNVIKEMATRLTFYFRDLIHMLAQMEQHLVQTETLDKNDKDEMDGNIGLLQTFIDNIEHLFLMEDDKNHVKWIEIEANGAKNAVYLYSEPIEMAEILAEDFFDQKQSVILTSATLTMKNSFAFIRDRLGLPDDRLFTRKINSPFLYHEQVQLMVPDDFPDIRHGDTDGFIYSTCEAILSLAEVTKGRMLVLFTSYDMLRKSYTILREAIDITEYVLIAQGISSGSRSRLKKNFIHNDHSILLGTSSFWEGVDIPGEDLSCLVIVRLPFQPPNHPIYEAKANDMKQAGKNAFMELSLPNAVIRFKQGFGRLIRSANDRGIVFVCDARIIKARYGKYFTDSIPNVPTTFASTNKLIEIAEDWF